MKFNLCDKPGCKLAGHSTSTIVIDLYASKGNRLWQETSCDNRFDHAPNRHIHRRLTHREPLICRIRFDLTKTHPHTLH